MKMTWKEFKEAIDKALAEAGKSDAVTIGYMDLDLPQQGGFESGNMEVVIHDNEIVVH